MKLTTPSTLNINILGIVPFSMPLYYLDLLSVSVPSTTRCFIELTYFLFNMFDINGEEGLFQWPFFSWED